MTIPDGTTIDLDLGSDIATVNATNSGIEISETDDDQNVTDVT
jgi:hypothetical protein